jgi:hypothetical protein
MEEVVYSADSQLRAPRRFAAELRADMRVAPAVAWRLFLHGLRAGHRRSWLGYVWLLLPPLATTATWVYLNHTRVLDVGPTDVPYPVYVLAGTLLWQVFAEALHSPLQQLSSARNILTRSRTPHEALMLAGLFEVLFNFAVRAAVLLPVFLWFGLSWGASVLLVPLGVAALLLLGFSLGLLLTPTGLLYHDVSRGLSLVDGLFRGPGRRARRHPGGAREETHSTALGGRAGARRPLAGAGGRAGRGRRELQRRDRGRLRGRSPDHRRRCGGGLLHLSPRHAKTVEGALPLARR